LWSCVRPTRAARMAAGPDGCSRGGTSSKSSGLTPLISPGLCSSVGAPDRSITVFLACKFPPTEAVDLCRGHRPIVFSLGHQGPGNPAVLLARVGSRCLRPQQRCLGSDWMYWSPFRLMRPKRCLPPVDFCRGVRPTHAANSRALRNAAGLATVAAMPVAMMASDHLRLCVPFDVEAVERVEDQIGGVPRRTCGGHDRVEHTEIGDPDKPQRVCAFRPPNGRREPTRNRCDRRLSVNRAGGSLDDRARSCRTRSVSTLSA
jgi:hypothetical protein